MRWTRLVSGLIAFGLVVWAIGALVTLVIGPLDDPRGLATFAVLAVVVVALVATIAVGARSRVWVENPYW